MKMRVLITITLILCQTMCLYAQKHVEYYVHTKTYYKDGSVVVEPGNSGQFITRNGNVCYDSNRDGFSVNNGVLQLVTRQGNNSKYIGTCYYKGECSYTFYDDKGVLNIQDVLNNVYVYKRQVPPSNVRTSSLIKDNSQNITVISGSHDSQTKVFPCGVCYQTGKCSFCNGTGISRNHAPGIIAKCGACGGTGKCSSCGGDGVKTL